MKKTEHLAIVGLLALMILSRKATERKHIKEVQMMTRLGEFFDKQDLTYAKKDYLNLRSHYSPEQSFNMVVIKGGGEI